MTTQKIHHNSMGHTTLQILAIDLLGMSKLTYLVRRRLETGLGIT